MHNFIHVHKMKGILFAERMGSEKDRLMKWHTQSKRERGERGRETCRSERER